MAIEFKTPEVIEKHLRGIQVVAENAMRPDSRLMDDNEHERPRRFISMVWPQLQEIEKTNIAIALAKGKRAAEQANGSANGSTNGAAHPNGGTPKASIANLQLVHMIEMMSWGDAGIYLCIPASALAGAAVSSTAVTVALARTARGGGSPLPLAGAAALAAMVSILRTCIIVLLIGPAAFAPVAPVALAAAACFAAFGVLFLLRADPQAATDAPARNPFELVPLLLFAFLFGAVSTVSAALAGTVGSDGLLATSTLSGAFDVDVATLSALRLIGSVITSDMAGKAVLAALAANTVGRLSIAVLAGPVRFWAPLAAANIVAVAVGCAAFFLLPAP